MTNVVWPNEASPGLSTFGLDVPDGWTAVETPGVLLTLLAPETDGFRANILVFGERLPSDTTVEEAADLAVVDGTGGAAITGYVITASPGGNTARTTAVTSFTVGALTNGTGYTFTVSAVNSAGSGPKSAPSTPVRPKAPTAPTAPTAVTGTAGYQSATVVWAAPSSDGGSPVTAYTVTAQPGGATVGTDGSARRAVLTGLTNGTSYTLSVVATNAAGSSAAGAAPGAVVPTTTVPLPPASLQAAAAGNGAVRLAWVAPTSDGGSPITGYTISSTPGAKALTTDAVTTSATLTGLTSGTGYTVTVVARNAIGASPAATSAPTTPDATAAARTVVLTADTLAALTAVHTDGSLTFTNPPTQVTGLRSGDVVVAGVSTATPDGLLRTVTALTTSGSTTTVTTSPAALDQALAAGDLAVSGTLAAGQVASFAPAHDGVRLAAPGSAAAGGSLSSGLRVTVDTDLYKDTHGATIHVQGEVTVTPTIALDASVSLTGHTSAHFTASVQSTTSISLTAQLSRTLTAGLPLGSVTFAPITFTVGPVPVVLVPKLDLTLNASGTVTVGLVTTASASTTYGVTLTSTDGAVTAAPIFTHTASYTPPTLYDTVTAKIGPRADLSLLLYGVAGPYVSDQLWLPKFTANTSANPWWTLATENVVSAGFKLSALGRNLADWNKTPLFDKVVPLGDAGGPFMGVTIAPRTAAVAPGGTVQLTATVQRSPDQSVTWSAAAGIISGTGLFTAPRVAGVYQVTATSAASGLKPQTRGVLSVRVGGQPPAAPTKVTATSTSRGVATVRWAAPTDTGGLPLTTFRISSTPGGATANALSGASTARITGLTPGISYRFTVTAVNSAGSGPPPPPAAPS